jgi:hypothetical protein
MATVTVCGGGTPTHVMTDPPGTIVADSDEIQQRSEEKSWNTE